MNNENKLLDTNEWYIGTNHNDKEHVQIFLYTLLDAIECYNNYYYVIENGIYKSENDIVNCNLQYIIDDLMINWDTIQNL
jgi:hypothetical protein